MANNSSNRGLASADDKTRERVAKAGGNARKQDADYSELGRKGGSAAQDSGNAHQLTDEERSHGGSHSGGNFKNDRERASQAGRKGGSR